MKKEVLRIQDMNYEDKAGRSLRYISLCLMEGEITGFIGLAGSGKDLLVRMLTGEERYDSGLVSICGKRAAVQAEMADSVYKIVDSNYRIDDWTVAEYIGLVNNKSIRGIFRRKALEDEVQKLFDALGLHISVYMPMRMLSELEKRLVDVAKAHRRQAKILIIEDEFEGFSKEEIIQFKQCLGKLITGRMTAVINNHSDMVTGILAERFVIFKKGRIVKKCRRDYIKNQEHLEKFLLGTSLRTKKHTLDSLDKESGTDRKEVYRVSHILLKDGSTMEVSFHKGEIVTFLTLNRKVKEEIFEVLSGRFRKAEVKRWIGGEVCALQDISDFVRCRIVSVAHLGNVEELLPSMSVGENILVPSLNKISSLEYTMAERRLVKMLEKEMNQSGMEKEEKIRELNVDDRIVLTLERWSVYNPKVMILLEPFVQCDTYGVSLVKSYIKKMAANGTAVIVIKSREEYMEELSDRFIKV